jgi:peptidoglycan-N-acetylglucosamine deacetylase
MSNEDDRTRSSSFVAALADVPLLGHALPALAGSWPAGFPGSPAPIWPALRRALGVEDRTTSRHGYALTFDDGPHPQGTPAILEILAREGVSATFFVVGEQVRRNPALVREMIAAGHQIGLHCDRHRNLLRLAGPLVREDLARARQTIEDAASSAIELYRPPYGVLTAAALREARSHGWRTLLWTHWGRDWGARATSESITRLVTDRVEPGAVLLLHDADDYSAPGSWRRTAAALPGVLAALAAEGLSPVAP